MVIIERFGAVRIDFNKCFILLLVILLSGLQRITFVMQLLPGMASKNWGLCQGISQLW
jgi:hypothetical protein